MTKRPWLWAVVVLNLVALVALAFAYPHLMVSPGPLVQAHEALATDCFACHVAWRGAASARCVACHAVADIGRTTTQGLPVANRAGRVAFHQSLVAQDCMGCHGDHQGRAATTLGGRGFSHAQLKPDVRGRCASCHAAPRDAVHPDPRATCSACHTDTAWKPATFEHDRYFVLDRDHRTTCATCHTSADPRQYTCYGCHEHRPAKVRAEHLKEGIRDFENCVQCHRDPGVEPEKPGHRERGRRERD